MRFKRLYCFKLGVWIAFITGIVRGWVIKHIILAFICIPFLVACGAPVSSKDSPQTKGLDPDPINPNPPNDPIVPGPPTTTTTLMPRNPGNTTCAPGAKCFTVNETFKASAAEPRRVLRFNVPNGNYKRVTMHMNLKITEFSTHIDPSVKLPSHTLFHLTRNGRNNDMIGYSFLKKDKSITLRHGIDVPHGNKTKETKKFKQLVLGETYRVEYYWDTYMRKAELNIKDLDGTVLVTLNQYPPNVSTLEMRGNDYIALGLSDNFGHVEVPSYGWEYSKIFVEALPQ